MPDEPRATVRAWLAVLLAAVAGFVDVVAYFYLAGLLAAPMTSNTVRVGLAIGTGQWPLAAQGVQAIPLFLLGVMGGALLCELAARRCEGQMSVVLPLGVEWLLLATFWAAGSQLSRDGALPLEAPWQSTLLVACTVGAMGLQTAALRRVGRLTVRTTFVTGVLATLGEEAVQYGLWLWGRARGRPAPARGSTGQLAVLGSIWGGYVLGAAAAARVVPQWGLAALALPLAVLGGYIGLELYGAGTWRR
ncbi:MAG TPA: YoaK family protein [Chloroflexota bacterium]|nr:YoaK family protein [Chloroflexota bacterium]